MLASTHPRATTACRSAANRFVGRLWLAAPPPERTRAVANQLARRKNRSRPLAILEFHISHTIFAGMRENGNPSQTREQGRAGPRGLSTQHARRLEAKMPGRSPNVASAPCPPITPPSITLASPTLQRRGDKDQSFSDGTTPTHGQDDTAITFLTPGRWPRVLPGL